MVPASVLQINVSNGGVPKRPVLFGEVTKAGLVGDRQAHPQIHGGPRQALLLMTNEGLEELKSDGFPLYPGALGENVTTQGLDRRTVRLGQRYRLGEVIIEITKMRRPCDQLNPYGEGTIQSAVFDKDVKAGITESPRWGLAGFYAAVIQPGILRPGDPIELLEESC
jgi:MOSC domain-containing protein YiiM